MGEPLRYPPLFFPSFSPSLAQIIVTQQECRAGKPLRSNPADDQPGKTIFEINGSEGRKASFLKKRSKKLLFYRIGAHSRRTRALRVQIWQSVFAIGRDGPKTAGLLLRNRSEKADITLASRPSTNQAHASSMRDAFSSCRSISVVET